MELDFNNNNKKHFCDSTSKVSSSPSQIFTTAAQFNISSNV